MREKINFRNRGNEKLTLDEGFKKFITTKKAMKLSDRSIGFYEDCFRYFTSFCTSQTLVEDRIPLTAKINREKLATSKRKKPDRTVGLLLEMVEISGIEPLTS